jgi:hypothetical protein
MDDLAVIVAVAQDLLCGPRGVLGGRVVPFVVRDAVCCSSPGRRRATAASLASDRDHRCGGVAYVPRLGHVSR